MKTCSTASRSSKRAEVRGAGADVVGLNCQRGPTTLMPIVRRVREAVSLSCRGAAGAVPDPREGTVVPVVVRRALARRMGRQTVPDRARSVHLQPLRMRGIRAKVSPSTCGTSGSAVALRPIPSARSPRPSAALCRVVVIRRTCPSTPSSGPMQPFRIATRTAAPKSNL